MLVNIILQAFRICMLIESLVSMLRSILMGNNGEEELWSSFMEVKMVCKIVVLITLQLDIC